MNRSAIAQGSLKANRRRKLAGDLTEVNYQLGALSNILTIQDIEISTLSNLVDDNISKVASLSYEYYPFKTSANSKITTLQAIDLVFYDDLRNLDNKIDVVEENPSLSSSNITHAFLRLYSDFKPK